MYFLRRAATLAAVALVGLGVAVPASAVVGGDEARAAEYPWLAAIGSAAFPLRPGGHFCGGALIAPDRVLTAGHCAVFAAAVPTALRVTFGRDDLTVEGGITVGVTSIRLDPGFRVSVFDGELAFHHDVAVLVLDRPVALPTVSIGSPHGDSATVVGWGASADGDWSNTRLRAATIPLRPDAACATAYGDDFDPAEAVCAGSPAADTGEFDSGGPLLVDGRVVGITSWAKGAAQPGYPGVYARVPSLVF
ncbi:serine protease [Nocardia sp. CDC159]|uniref:Serine protease n=1 Tax=Nocardia pulmonis TaxID=2951408 RepID=A0A9X2E641_9NOCA|nr:MULTISPECIES: serine protease [Nocardia]MCM6772291.1 serine protease [Nocardia pulmonis]MCM6785051.1 serine protease [Nocardia sp. CDC159]